MRQRCLVLLALACVAVSPAAAQTSSRESLALEFRATGARIDDEGRRAGDALTLGVALGHGIGEHVIVLFGADVGGGRFGGESAITGFADLALRYFPWRPRMVSPYGEVAFTAHGREIDGVNHLGTGFSAGLGAEYRVSERLALMAAASRMWGRYDEADGEEIPRRDAVIGRLRLGVILRPPR